MPPRAVRASRYPVKPMSVEDAALQLEAGTEVFLVFRNAATDTINILLPPQGRPSWSHRTRGVIARFGPFDFARGKPARRANDLAQRQRDGRRAPSAGEASRPASISSCSPARAASDARITIPYIQKTGLALAGFDEYLRPGRVLVFGESEIRYLERLSSDERHASIAANAAPRHPVHAHDRRFRAAAGAHRRHATTSASRCSGPRIVTPNAIAKVTACSRTGSPCGRSCTAC